MNPTQRQPLQKIHNVRTASAPVQNQCVFTTTQEHLTRALRLVGGVAGKNPALPVLEHVLIKSDHGQLRLSTTDLEVGVTVWLAGMLNGEGAITIPFRTLAEYVQNLPLSPLEIEIGRGSLTIATAKGVTSANTSHAVFQGESAENFPLIPHLEAGQEVVFSASLFHEALERVLYAVATEDTRPELASLSLHGAGVTLTLAATDSFRLAEAHFPLATPLQAPCAVMIPGRAAQELRRVLSAEGTINLKVGETQLLFHLPTLHLVSRRIEGTYPDYANIIPQRTATSVEVNRQELLRAIRAAAALSEQAIGQVTLEVGADRLLVTAVTPEVGETKNALAGEIEGEPAIVAFNARFLKEALAALPGERVAIGLGSATTPAVFKPVPARPAAAAAGGTREPRGDTLALLALVMPIKL